MTTSGSGTSYVQHYLDELYDAFQIVIDKSIAKTDKEAKALAAKYVANLGKLQDTGEQFVFSQREPDAFVPGVESDRTSEPEKGIKITYRKLAQKPEAVPMLEGKKKFGARKLEKLTKQLKTKSDVENPWALAKAIQKGTVSREGDQNVKPINEQLKTSDLQAIKDEAAKSNRRDPREPEIPSNLPADQKGIEPGVERNAEADSLSKSNKLTAAAYEMSMRAQTTGKHSDAAKAHREAATAAREAGLLERALRHQEQAAAHDNLGKETTEMAKNWVDSIYEIHREEEEEVVKASDDEEDEDEEENEEEAGEEEEEELDIPATAAKAQQLATDAEKTSTPAAFEEAGDVALKLAHAMAKKGMREEAKQWYGAGAAHKAKAFEMGLR